MHTRSWPTSPIITSVAFVLAAPAQAGTLTLRSTPPDPGNRYDQGQAWWEFEAAPGERNDIVVERLPGGGFRLTDLGAPTKGCPADGPSSVVCTIDTSLHVDAGDGDDSVVINALASAGGGPGNDRLVALGTGSLDGGAGDDRLEGSPDDDDLDGGAGRDVVLAGAGRDDVTDGDEDADRLDGGEGDDDRITYRGRRGVRVDLARDRGPHGDVLPRIEHVHGSDGPDVLLGDEGANELDGVAGPDRLQGRGGADILDGDEGEDTVFGGAGDDRLATVDGDPLDGGAGDDLHFAHVGGSARIRCGAGRDGVDVEGGGPRLRRDCETVTGSGPIVRITATRLLLRWDSDEYRRPCRLRATVDGRMTVLRRVNGASVPARGAATVRLQPTQRCRGAFGRGYAPTAFRLLAQR